MVAFPFVPGVGTGWGQWAWRWFKKLWGQSEAIEGVADDGSSPSRPDPATLTPRGETDPPTPDAPTQGTPVSFHVHDGYTGLIRIRIVDQHASFTVDHVNDVSLVARAIQEARARGATSGTWFTGDVVNPHLADQYGQLSEKQRTWLGGRVTRLPDGPEGDPQFRIDWNTLSEITD
jgi:hypothetical protein